MKNYSKNKNIAALSLLCFSCGTLGWEPPNRENGTTFWTDDPALMPALRSAVARLSAATGRDDIAVEPGGVPVSFRPSVQKDGDTECALTIIHSRGLDYYASEIQIASEPPAIGHCATLESVLLHEGIHRLSPTASHTATGLFASRTDATRLDEESLERLCEGFDCLAFVPESGE